MSVLPIGLHNTTGAPTEKQTIKFAGKQFFTWNAVAEVQPGVTAASLDLILPTTEKGWDNVTGLVIPANAQILAVGMKIAGALTLGAATGRLKLAATLTAATASLYVESAAAAANVLAAQTVETNNPLDATDSVGGSAVTYRLFATDGGAGGAAVASTVTASVLTRVHVRVAGYYPSPFPPDSEFGEIIDQSLFQDVVN